MTYEAMKAVNTYRLTIMDVIHYSNGIVELIADEAVTITGEHAREMLDLVRRIEPGVRGVLANRKNSYSFSFEGQREIAGYQGIKAVAILTPSRIAYLAAKFAQSKYFKIGVFLDRAEALAWLQEVINVDP